MTGLPGWVGRSPTGLGLGAQFLTTGAWPAPQAQLTRQATQSGQFGRPFASAPGVVPFAPQPADELEFLKNQAELLQSQLEQIQSLTAELGKKARKKESGKP